MNPNPRPTLSKEEMFFHYHGEIVRLQAVVLEQWGQGAFVGGKCLWDEIRYLVFVIF